MAQLPTAGDWRDLARRVQDEKDPDKMVALAQQLVAKFDEEQRKTMVSRKATTAE